jgi:lysozyme
LNKYFDSAIIITSICSIGLVVLSITEDTLAYGQPETVQDIQLQRLENHLTVHLNQPKTVNSTSSQSQPVSAKAINLIKEFEGFENEAYIDTDGTPVIGYGFSRIADQPVQIGDRISTQQADVTLNKQLKVIQQELNQMVTVELSDRQLSALASLAFNIGVDFVKNSTLIRKLNAGDYNGAANEFLRWDKANIGGILVQMPGLIRRRQAERELFLELE